MFLFVSYKTIKALSNIFSKGWDKADQKEGLLKRLENIKDKKKRAAERI